MTETIKQAKELLRYYREQDIPTWLHSAPGIGKSSVVKQLTQELRVGFIDIRLGTRLPEDLNGIPAPDLEHKVAVWLKASFWPDEKRDGKSGIILFDELSDAPRSLQSCAYQLILDRRLNDFELPKGWWPCAAGNRREDRAAAQSISTALANRFAHIEVMPDKDAWKEWANLNKIDPLVVAFVDYRSALLHKMPEDGTLAWPSPRAWAQVSKVINAPDNLRFKLVRGIVGEGAAGEYEAFLKAVNLPDLKDIIKRPKVTPIPTEPASRYALASMLAREANVQNFDPICQYISRQDFGREFEMVCVIDAVKRDDSLCDTHAFTDFSKRNQDITL